MHGPPWETLMRARTPWRARSRARFLPKRYDTALFSAAFAALVGVGVVSIHWPGLRAVDDIEVVLSVALGAGFIVAAMHWRMAWHLFANRFFLRPLVILVRPWVIDGDTLDDLASNVRYRVANIDAPETDSTCYREADRARQAKWALIGLVRRARVVSVRPTFRFDRYGRRVAFVLIDGQDAGRWLVAQGLAVPWRGRRKRWCGPSGGLAQIARSGARPHQCKTCRAL